MHAVSSASFNRLFFGVAVAGTVLCGLSMMALAALGSTVERDLGLSHTQFGILQSAGYAGNLTGSVLFAYGARRYSLKQVALVVLGLLILGNLLSAVPALPLLAPGRFCLGVGNCGIVLFGCLLAVDAHPARQGAFLNLMHGAVSAGGCLGMLVTLPLAGALGAWSRVPLLLALSLLVPALVLLWPPPPAAHPPEPVSGLFTAWLRLVRHPALRRTAAPLFAYILAETAVFMFFPIYIQKAGGFTAAAAANLVALFVAGIFAGRMVVAWLDRPQHTRRLTLALLLAGGAVMALAALPLALHPGAGAVLLTLAGVLMGPTAPLAVSLTVKEVGRDREHVLAVTNFMMCLGGLAGGALVGAWCDLLGLRTALLLSAGVFALAALPLLRRHAPAPPPP